MVDWTSCYEQGLWDSRLAPQDDTSTAIARLLRALPTADLLLLRTTTYTWEAPDIAAWMALPTTDLFLFATTQYGEHTLETNDG